MSTASTGYKSKIIARDHGTNTSALGAYQILCRNKTLPSPFEAPNLVEATTLQDGAQTNVLGIKQNGAKTITMNYTKEEYAAVMALEGKTLDLMWLYGQDGLGALGKFYAQGEAIITPNEIGGNDNIIEATVTLTLSTVAVYATDLYDVTESSGTFTVAAHA